ncbi:transposable element Tcb1 transposase [Trichonephila clavipes]|nr:transposable element Tcb1 transposase [Trichonephila clavipes]
MTAQRYIHDILEPHVLPLITMAPRNHFSTRQCSASHGKGVTRLSPHCYYSPLASPIPRFVSNRVHLGSFGTASWASHEFERTRSKDTANMERNVKTSCRTCMPQCPIVSHRAFTLEVVQQGIKPSILLPFSLK